MKLFDKLYSEIGKITIEFETMNLMIRNYIRRIETLDKNEYIKLERLGFEKLYKIFKKTLKKTTLEIDYIVELYEKLNALREKRNNIIHSYCMIGNVVITYYNLGKVERLKETEPTASFYNIKTGKNFKYTIEELIELNNDCKALTSEILKLDNL